MLADLRKALADTIASGMAPSDARVLAYPPKSIDMPSSGIHVHVAPDDPYVEAWQSFSVTGRAMVRYSVVITITDGRADVAWDRLDDLVDPMSTSPNVFGAIAASPTLGVTAFQVDAKPLLEAVSSAQRVAEADGSVTFYEVTLPVQCIVQRS